MPCVPLPQSPWNGTPLSPVAFSLLDSKIRDCLHLCALTFSSSSLAAESAVTSRQAPMSRGRRAALTSAALRNPRWCRRRPSSPPTDVHCCPSAPLTPRRASLQTLRSARAWGGKAAGTLPSTGKSSNSSSSSSTDGPALCDTSPVLAESGCGPEWSCSLDVGTAESLPDDMVVCLRHRWMTSELRLLDTRESGTAH